MKTYFSNLILISLSLPLGSALAALPFEEACRGTGLSIVDGMCYCEGLSDFVSPWKSRTAAICAISTQSRNECLNPALPYSMRFIDRRCYCPATRQFIGKRVRFNRAKDSETLAVATKNHSLYSSEILQCQTNSHKLGYQPGERISGARSIRLEALLPGAHGAGIYQVSRLPGQEWDNSIDDNTLQGDPRENIEILGPKLSQFFGFSEVGDRLHIPRWDHLNTRIFQVNLSLEIFNPSVVYERYKIPFHFYPASGLVGLEDYLKRFAYDGGLPIAEVQSDGDENLLFHDTNYHTAKWMVMPNALIRFSQNQAKAIFEFKKYFSERAPEKVNLPQFKYFFHLFFYLKASQIDKGSGLLSFYGRQDQIHNSAVPEFPVLSEREESDLTFQSAEPLIGIASSVQDYLTTTAIGMIQLFPEPADQILMRQILKEFDDLQSSKDPLYTFSVSFLESGREKTAADLQIDYIASIIEKIKQLELNVPMHF